MKKRFLSMSVILLAGLMTGCASTVQTEPGAENVKVMTGAVPKSCQFRGNVGVGQTEIYRHKPGYVLLPPIRIL